MPTSRPMPHEFRTGDLGIAAFLVSKDLPLLLIDANEQRSVFIFPAHRTAERCTTSNATASDHA